MPYDIAALHNESDVEQLFLIPLLKSKSPSGFGYDDVDIRTKPDIRQLLIGKGQSSKLYHPDYVIVLAGYPVAVIEAKHPDHTDLDGALREARLYATELNAQFPAGINPCRRLLVSNGLNTISSPNDTAEIDLALTQDQFVVSDPRFEQLIQLFSRTTMQCIVDELHRTNAPSTLYSVPQFLGGSSRRNEELGYNEFGSHLALDYRRVFIPRSRDERAYIVRKAYIQSQRRDHYVEEIDQLMRSAIATSPGVPIAGEGFDPSPLITALRRGPALQSEVMLLVGGRGCGKSTFVDYFREVKLPADLHDTTTWIRMNLNEAPQHDSLLEDWILAELLKGFKSEFPSIDFDDYDTLEILFHNELSVVRKGPLKRLSPDSEAYKVRIADTLRALTQDKIAYAKAIAHLVCHSKHKLLVVVFDNSDKREPHDQLRMFQIAQWIQAQIHCLVFLPLRDSTFDAFKNTPPLDTVIKDFIFKIDPPRFTDILAKRIDLVLHDLHAKSKSKLLEYTLPNKMLVQYPATDLGYYLACIYRSLYEHDRLVRRLIVGLAGRDIRRGFEIFLEFCRSGHIGEEEYFKIRMLKGKYSLPRSVVARVLLRRSRRFYDGDDSFLDNMFQCDSVDAQPDHFARLFILSWLHEHMADRGPAGVRGFHQAHSLLADAIDSGHVASRMRAELRHMVTKGTVLVEHQRQELKSDDDLICLTAAGYAHWMMMSNIDYLAACAEDTWLADEDLAKRVAERIGAHGTRGHFSYSTLVANAEEYLDYLADRADATEMTPGNFLVRNIPKTVVLLEGIRAELRSIFDRNRRENGWRIGIFREGQRLQGFVKRVADYGVFVEIDNGPTGLMHSSNIPANRPPTSFGINERITVEIMSINRDANKASLAFVNGE